MESPAYPLEFIQLWERTGEYQIERVYPPVVVPKPSPSGYSRAAAVPRYSFPRRDLRRVIELLLSHLDDGTGLYEDIYRVRGCGAGRHPVSRGGRAAVVGLHYAPFKATHEPQRPDDAHESGADEQAVACLEQYASHDVLERRSHVHHDPGTHPVCRRAYDQDDDESPHQVESTGQQPREARVLMPPAHARTRAFRAIAAVYCFCHFCHPSPHSFCRGTPIAHECDLSPIIYDFLS